MSDGLMDELIDQAHGLAADIEGAALEFTATVDRTLADVPGPLQPLVRPVRQQMQLATAAYQVVRSTVRDVLSHAGDPLRLDHVGEQWAAGVADRLTVIADSIQQTELRTDNFWTGAAAVAYQENMAQQREKLTELRDLALRMRDSVESTGDAITIFWVVFVAALLELLLGLVGGTIAAATVIGLPAAVAAVAAVYAHVVTYVSGAFVALKTWTDIIEESQHGIAQELRNLGDSWPVPRFSDLTGRGAAGWQPLP